MTRVDSTKGGDGLHHTILGETTKSPTHVAQWAKKALENQEVFGPKMFDMQGDKVIQNSLHSIYIYIYIYFIFF